MNKYKLLTGLLAVALSGGWACGRAQSVITLEDIFRSAEINSRQLRPAFTSSAEADQAMSVARAALLPDINLSLSLSYLGNGFTTARNFSDCQKAPIPHFGNGLQIDIMQPVYTGGSVTSSIELARLKSTSARYAADFQRDNIRFRLTGFYLDLYKNINLQKIVESNIATARLVLREMHARHSQGTALQNDITRYELLVADLELQLVRIGNTVRILNDNLVVTAGLPEGMTVVPDSTILTRSLPVHGEDWWKAEAAASSPALNLARNDVGISRTMEALVKSERLPKISLHAGWSLDGPILIEIPPINRNLSCWHIGVTMSYNLSSLYKSNRSLTRSRIATRKSEEQLEASRENLDLAVNADYVRYLEAYEELKTRRKSVELAERNYNLVSTRYSEGMALITDMLDAASSKLDAEQKLVNARINIIYYYHKLLFTTGKI